MCKFFKESYEFRKGGFPIQKKKFKNPLCALKSLNSTIKSQFSEEPDLGCACLLAFHTGWPCAKCIPYKMPSHKKSQGGLSPNLHFSDQAQRNDFPKDFTRR